MRGPRTERPLALVGLGTGLLAACIAGVAVAWFMLDPGGSSARRPPSPRGGSPPRPARTENPTPTTLPNFVLGPLPRAVKAWQESRGPARIVIDQVYLVPDVPTFFEAIGWWDNRHFFPVLIDDPAWTLPFLRAFHPSRVVRFASRANPEGREEVWSSAVRAVGRSWSSPGHADSGEQDGAKKPRGLGRTPPGVVLSDPDSPSLPGGVALAAGRFQPLVRFEPRIAEAMSPDGDRRHPSGGRFEFSSTLSLAEARSFARRLEDRVAAVVADYGQLGDACDFLTLAADWPYRYLNDRETGPARGEASLDDLVGRILEPELANLGKSKERWAFSGRLLGGPSASVYRAMCALFLPPDSSLLWNTYGGNEPWNYYGMSRAAELLARAIPGPLRHRGGADANLINWHRLSPGPRDRTRLVFFNSSGDPKRFAIEGAAGRPADIPPGGPSAVVIIHSFSASDPMNPRTIAGRWLTLGAFAYFGSMNEPFLTAFRPPALEAELLAAGVPLSAAVRQGPPEPFGQPWRLVYLGDPLYQLRLSRRRGDMERTNAVEDDEFVRLDPNRWKPPPDDAAEILARPNSPSAASSSERRSAGDSELRGCLDAAIADSCGHDDGGVSPRDHHGTDWRSTLASIARDRLNEHDRAIWDSLVIDAILEPGGGGDPAPWYERLMGIPVDQWTPKVEAMLEYRVTERLAAAAGAGDHEKALTLWDEMIRRPWPSGSEFPAQMTERVGALAGSANRLREWHDRLRKAQAAVSADAAIRPASSVVAAELKRVESELAQ